MFPEPFDRHLLPRPQSSNTFALLGQFAMRTLLFSIALAFLPGSAGVHEASAQVVFHYTSGGRVCGARVGLETNNQSLR